MLDIHDKRTYCTNVMRDCSSASELQWEAGGVFQVV
jgi:hypothetical protein